MWDTEFGGMHVNDKPSKSFNNEITSPQLLVLHTQKDSGLHVSLMDHSGVISTPTGLQCLGQDWSQDWSQVWPPVLHYLEKQ